MNQSVKENQPIRIAEIIGLMSSGGVEATVLNYYRKIDRSRIQFDFYCYENSPSIPRKEIEELGGRIFLVPSVKHLHKFKKILKQQLSEGHYTIIHSHLNALSVFPLQVAKKVGIPIRIAHSHSTTSPHEPLRNLIKLCLRRFSKRYANYYAACSQMAGTWLFGKRIVNEGRLFVMKNAIDLQAFSFSLKSRNEIRQKWNLAPNQLVIGDVGRLVTQKNPFFALDVFESFHKRYPSSVFFFLGEGSLKDQLTKSVANRHLTQSVIFAGAQPNPGLYYSAFDFLVLPSYYEGFGMAALEGQTNGLYCLVSPFFSPEVFLTDHLVKLPIKKEDSNVWSATLSQLVSTKAPRANMSSLLKEKGFSIDDAVHDLENFYLSLISQIS
jgi:glycosyltransferase involved in cell wall biosynthesis